MTVVEKKEAAEAVLAKMQAVISDPDVKLLGPAKGGGKWFKSSKTGTLYRMDKEGEAYKVVETRETALATKKQMKKADTANVWSRQELMEQAKAIKIKYFRILSKSELMQALAKETTPEAIAKIQNEAIKRWKDGSSVNK